MYFASFVSQLLCYHSSEVLLILDQPRQFRSLLGGLIVGLRPPPCKRQNFPREFRCCHFTTTMKHDWQPEGHLTLSAKFVFFVLYVMTQCHFDCVAVFVQYCFMPQKGAHAARGNTSLCENRCPEFVRKPATPLLVINIFRDYTALLSKAIH